MDTRKRKAEDEQDAPPAKRNKLARLSAPRVVFIVGEAPFKAAMCADIVREFSYQFVALRDLLENRQASSDEAVAIVKDFLIASESPVLLDGFPRNKDDMQAWCEAVDACGVTLEFALILDGGAFSPDVKAAVDALGALGFTRVVESTEQAVCTDKVRRLFAGRGPTPIRKIGICTCGGDCPGLNPVIRAVVRCAIQNYGWQVLGVEDSTSGLINLDYKSPHGNFDLTLDVVDDIISKGGTILGCSNKSHPFAFVVEDEAGKKRTVDMSDTLVDNFHKLDLDCLVMIGGDGTMGIANKLLEKGIPIVGVPKTIDNDLLSTDVTFGFDTAVQNITEALDKIRDTALSHDRVLVVEVMGRDAGWLALHSGIAAAVDVVVIPEVPYSVDAILSKIRDRRAHGHMSSLVVISEGAKNVTGDTCLREAKLGEMPKYKGAAEKLLLEMEAANNAAKGTAKFMRDLEVRASVLGYIQRGGSPSSYDRILGTRCGAKAVDLIAQKKFGYMACLRGLEVGCTPLGATKGQKLVDPNSDIVRMARHIGVCMADVWPNPLPADSTLSVADVK